MPKRKQVMKQLKRDHWENQCRKRVLTVSKVKILGDSVMVKRLERQMEQTCSEDGTRDNFKACMR